MGWFNRSASILKCCTVLGNAIGVGLITLLRGNIVTTHVEVA